MNSNKDWLQQKQEYLRKIENIKIADVLQHFGVKMVRQRAAGEIYCCPFCEDSSGHMYSYSDKNRFKCHRCGEYGDAIDFYSKLTQKKWVASCDDLISIFLNGTGSDNGEISTIEKTCVRKRKIKISETLPADQLDAVYRSFTEMLVLSDRHRNDLRKRGLTDAQIDEGGFRTVPSNGKPIVDALTAQGYNLLGVPGFYQYGQRIAMALIIPGFYIPLVDFYGNLVGFQIRIDEDYRDKIKNDNGVKIGKYLSFSSGEKNRGSFIYSSAHFVNVGENKPNETVYLTEGNLKCDIAAALSGKAFMGILGVNSTASLKSDLQKLKSGGTKRIVEALDMDKIKNVNVQNAAQKIREIIIDTGLLYSQLTWPETRKGIDDFLHGQNHA